MSENSIQSLGGKARADALSAEQRSQIAANAAAKRWPIKAGWEGELNIGPVKMKCAVIEGKDGKPIRVISETEFMSALGMYRSGALSVRRRPSEDGGALIPLFLAYKNLQPFIAKHLGSVHYQPLKVVYKNGNTGHGITDEMIPMICEIWMDAHKAGVLGKRQEQIAEMAELILRGLARVGIAALIDEATGYQKERAQRALAEILEEFISKELRPWTRTFPLEFYEQIFRLKGWPFDPKSVKRPAVIGHYTNDIVYKRLAPGVLDELRKKNPAVDGRRRTKHFQWLTGEVGDPKLRSHIDGVLPLMRISDSWEEFKKYLNKAYRVHVTTELGFDTEVLDV